MDKKVTWNDIDKGTAKEVMSTYKLSEKQLEQKVRKHLYGASQADMQRMYKKFYNSPK